jgi:hypothetical protein
MSKKIKCIKCNLYFKDRLEDEEKHKASKELCWNCRFVWQTIGIVLQSLPEKINRDVMIKLEDVRIRKKVPHGLNGLITSL